MMTHDTPAGQVAPPGYPESVRCPGCGSVHVGELLPMSGMEDSWAGCMDCGRTFRPRDVMPDGARPWWA